MEFGIFDHCEQSSRPHSQTYRERFRLAQRAEQAGFFAYHLAEHHGTPLSLTPSPNLFLAGLAQHTTKLRLGPLVYLLPLYEPYRLVQEICMLDNLCDGRLELGLGRGANPLELSFFHLNSTTAKERFDDLYTVLMEGLTEGRTVATRPAVGQGPIAFKTVQRPYPPIWYPSAGGSGSLAWAAQQGFNTIVNGPLAHCADAIKLYLDNFQPGPHGDSPKFGVTRYVYIADTDGEAMRVGSQAFTYHLANLTRLTDAVGIDVSSSPIMPPRDLHQAIAEGWAAVGSPATVREQLAHMFDTVGNNYFVFAPLMADLTLEWGLRTIELFKAEIMPAFKGSGTLV